MTVTKKNILAFLVALVGLLFTGCPSSSSNDNGSVDEPYHVGTWAGNIYVVSALVMREEPQYWNAAWRIEATVRLDEYQDGSISGTAEGDFFHWNMYDDFIHEYPEIATGHYDTYSVFKIDLTGRIGDEGYVLTADELPTSLIDPNNPNRLIDFWDFLFPGELSGEWPADGSKVMRGESIRAQGDDYRETSMLRTFREFSIRYTWNIKRL